MVIPDSIWRMRSMDVVHSHLLTEWIFIIISLVVAGIGMLLGACFTSGDLAWPESGLTTSSALRRQLQQILGRRILWSGGHATHDGCCASIYSFDSKMVDGIVNGLAWLSRQFSRVVGGFDKYFVDGIVNTIAAFIKRLMSPLFRAAQTGFTQNYALVMVLGLMVAWPCFLRKIFFRQYSDNSNE